VAFWADKSTFPSWKDTFTDCAAAGKTLADRSALARRIRSLMTPLYLSAVYDL
jgi:hypothetical protein